MKEPSILDYLKSLLFNDRKPINLAEYFGNESTGDKKEIKKPTHAAPVEKLRWQVILGALVAIAGQYFMEPDNSNYALAIGLYCASAILVWLGYKQAALQEFIPKTEIEDHFFSPDIRLIPFIISLGFIVAAFLTFTDNAFTWLNLLLWITSIVFFLLSVWEKEDTDRGIQLIHTRNKKFILLFLLAFAICAFFRFFRLDQVPGEMFSDHAEKLLDVLDVLNGRTPIYFTRNTGREAIQFYLTTAIIKVFNTGISFLSLKLGTALAGLAALPFIYLLGKQLANKWVGLIAMLMAGIAYWPNVISRVALRFALYPLFAAPVLYFLFKGLRENNRNDLVLSGIFLGMGLHGYSPARILPIYVVVVFLIYWLHNRNMGKKQAGIWILFLIAFASFILFLPLFRYFLENPTMVSYRALSRLTSIEQSVDGSALRVFLDNFWKSSLMFFFRNGQIWVHSIPNRPALDIISAAFLFIGLVYIIKRYCKFRDWEGLALLIAIPVLMLPSTLSLAFPGENPSLNRSGGAIIPVFIIAALGVYQFIRGFFGKERSKFIKTILGILVVIMLVVTLSQNYDLVFNQYGEQFLGNAWNTSEIGQVIADFIAEGNSPDNAFVVPYAHWVDTRLVGINAGFPSRDYALWAEDFEQTLPIEGNKLFILKPEDSSSLDELRTLYPEGYEEVFYSKTSGKNFIMYSIPMKQ